MGSYLTVRRLLPCLLVFLILVPTLDSQSLWWDEGISIHLATSSWKTIVVDRVSNIHPPLYFFVLKLWLSAAGLTPFSARYLSALVTVLLPAAVYSFLKHRFNRRSALTGSFLLSFAPPFIIYGQEVRAYAFLPLIFVALVGQIWEWKQPRETGNAQSSRAKGMILGITQILFVGFHYSGLFAIVLCNIYLFFRAITRKTKSDRSVLFSSIMIILMMALPWLILFIFLGMDGAFNQAGISNPFADPIPFRYLIKLLAVFSVIGLPEALDAAYVTRSLAVTALLVITVFLASLFKPRQKNNLNMLVIWLLPFIFVPVIWLLSPQAHPRYLLPYFIGGWMMVAVLISLPTVVKVLRITLLAATLVSAILGLDSYLFRQTYARSDVRTAALDIKERALPGDLVLIPNTDWSLPQYDTGNAAVIMLPPAQDEQAIAKALAMHKGSANVFLLDYDRNVLDPRGYVRFLMSRQGYLAERSQFHNVFLERYILSQPYTPPSCKTLSTVCVEGENLCLQGVDVPVIVVSGSMLPIALCWNHGVVTERYALAFRLYTDSGILVSSVDDLLVDTDRQPSDFWEDNTGFQSYHRLPVPLGLLPEFYKLEMSVYPVDSPTFSVSLIELDGKRIPAVELSQIQPSLSLWVDSSPETVYPEVTSNPNQQGNGLILSGTHIEPTSAAPGDNIYVTLLWQLETEGAHPPVVPELHMIQDGRVLSRVTTWAKFDQMPPHRPMLDYVLFPVPPDAASGEVDLHLYTGSTAQDIKIGTVHVENFARVFDAPEPQYILKAVVPGIATLIGFEIEPELVVKSGEPFTITLIWQAQENAAKNDLKVFVHLVDDEGDVLAQDDAKPVNWTRPTPGWLTGEILTDRHQLQWQKVQSGSGEILVGLYDTATGKRLVWDNGEDALKLPLRFDY